MCDWLVEKVTSQITDLILTRDRKVVESKQAKTGIHHLYRQKGFPKILL